MRNKSHLRLLNKEQWNNVGGSRSFPYFNVCLTSISLIIGHLIAHPAECLLLKDKHKKLKHVFLSPLFPPEPKKKIKDSDLKISLGSVFSCISLHFNHSEIFFKFKNSPPKKFLCLEDIQSHSNPTMELWEQRHPQRFHSASRGLEEGNARYSDPCGQGLTTVEAGVTKHGLPWGGR